MRDRYCIYLRKSRADLEAEQRGEGETLARHETALLELARRQELAIDKIHREVVSGELIAARPAMQQLLDEVEQGLWCGVLVMDIDRLARGETIDQGIIAQSFKYSGTKILTPIKTYDPDNEFDEEFFEFGLFMSRREYKMINRRLQRGRLASVREGKYVGSGQPYGYSRVKLIRAKGYTLAPVEEQAAVVQAIYSWYVDGYEGSRIGATAIANKLNAMGVRAPKGERWAASTVRDILHNPVYIGKIRWNWRPVSKRMEMGRRISCRPRNSAYDLVEGLHPAIVEEALWRRAQRLSETNSVPKKQGGGAVKNPLSGLVVCGVCGKRMVRKPNRGGAKDSLLCATPQCPNVSSTLEAVEEQLLLSLSQWLRGYRVALEERPAHQPDPGGKLGRQLYKSLEEAQRQKNKAHELLELGVYDVDTFLARKGEIDARIAALQNGIAETEAALRADEEREMRRQSGMPAVAHVLDSYGRAGTAAEKNALLKEVVEKAVYLREKGDRWHHPQFALHIYPRVGP